MKIRRSSFRLLIALLALPLSPTTLATENCRATQEEIQVDGGTIRYDLYGHDPSIVLLHGLFADKAQWHALACLLNQAGYSSIVPDLPGYGQSLGFPIEDYRLEREVALLHQFLTALGIRRYHVAGSSMGGTIAAMLSRQYPKESRSLAFIGSPQGIIGWSVKFENAITQGINPFIPITVEQFDLEMSLLFVTPPIIPLPAKESAVSDYSSRNRHYQQVWDIDNLSLLALTQGRWGQHPTLSIWGRDDQIFPLEGAKKLKAKIPRAEIIRLRDAGHLLMMENADQAAQYYLRFLERIPRMEKIGDRTQGPVKKIP